MSKNNIRLYRRIGALLLLSSLFIVLASACASRTETVQNLIDLPDPFATSVSNDPPVIGPSEPDPQQLRAPNAITIIDRRSDRLEITWHDRTEGETGYEVERRLAGDEWQLPSNSDWESVETFGPLSEWTTFNDTSVASDRLYCYRIVVFDDTRRIPSSERCAFTHDGRNIAVNRIQLQIITGDVSNAGTDDDVQIRLNSRIKGSPRGNQTWLDYSHNDFERDSAFKYDLNTRFVRDMSDITQIQINKPGDDAWCVETVRLFVNDRVAFEQTFDDGGSSCQWLNDDSDDTLLIPFRALRDHSAWQDYRPFIPVDFAQITTGFLPGNGPLPAGRTWEIPLRSDNLGIRGADIQSRIESIIGHEIHGQDAHWMVSSASTSSVSVSRDGEKAVHVRFGLIAELPFLPNSEIHGTFRLNFDLTCSASGDRVDFAVNLTDFDAVVENPTALPGIGFIDDAIEEELNASPISFNLRNSVPLAGLGALGSDPECEETEVTVLDDGTVKLSITLVQRFTPDAPDPGPVTDD